MTISQHWPNAVPNPEKQLHFHTKKPPPEIPEGDNLLPSSDNSSLVML